MGPLERSLQGKAPGGKQLSEKQINDIRELDGLLGEMGSMADNIGGE